MNDKPKNCNENNENIIKNNVTEDKTNVKSNYSSTDIINNLKNEINNLKKDTINITIREQANIENINKNSKNKIKKIKEFQLEIFSKNLIPIIDNFKNIKKHIFYLNIQNNALIQGIFLILKSLLNTTKKFGLTSINSKTGDIFNSKYHQVQSNGEIPHNTNNLYIKSIIKQGYLLNQKVILKTIVTTSTNNNETKKTN